jgi:predicted molibdopterin-dependent oxidoreductase YjgC
MAADEGGRRHEILAAAAAREIDVLFLIGVDPLRDEPDARLARQALDNVPMKVVQSLELGSLAPFADAFLPAAAVLEKDGHFTDWEGRSQRLQVMRPSAGISRPDWEIFCGLAAAMGEDLGFDTLDELHEEMGGLLAPLVTVGGSGEPTRDQAAHPADGAVELFTYPLLVDDGRLSDRADRLKAALGEEPFLEIHPDTASRLGLTDGGHVEVVTAAGGAELPVRVADTIAIETAFVPFNQRGFAANTLLSGAFLTPATLSAAAPADADAGGPDEAPAPDAPAAEEVSA